MDILEYGVPAARCREFTVQEFDPVDQGADKPKDEKSSKPKHARKCKAEAPTKPTGEKKFYCDLHGHNKTHNTKDFYELKRHTKHAKQGKERKDMDKVTYKELNTFVNAKVTAALKKAKKFFKKEKKDKQIKLNAFDKIRMLNVDESSNDEDKQDVHVSFDVDDGSNSDSK
eukprot:3226271-Ditylum_brightwellii.AAC.1